MKCAALCGALLVAGVLVGCDLVHLPAPDPRDIYPFDPYDYGRSVEGARAWLTDVRSAWVYARNSSVSDLEYSLIFLTGDCDDFAVLLAYWFQEFWACDTVIACLDSCVPWCENHAVCFVRADQFPQEPIYRALCPPEPLLRSSGSGVLYRPLDWGNCVNWTWSEYDVGLYLRNLETGRLDCVGLVEWYEAYSYRMEKGGR